MGTGARFKSKAGQTGKAASTTLMRLWKKNALPGDGTRTQQKDEAAPLRQAQGCAALQSDQARGLIGLKRFKKTTTGRFARYC